MDDYEVLRKCFGWVLFGLGFYEGFFFIVWYCFIIGDVFCAVYYGFLRMVLER